MADRITIEKNTPGWFDLSTADPEGSRTFYSKLFGWTADVIPDPQAGGYGFFNLDGKMVAGVGPVQSKDQPTAWASYIHVSDAAGAVARGERSRFVQEEQLGEAAGPHQRVTAPVAESKTARDPPPAGEPPPDSAGLVVQAASVAVHQATRGVGDQLSERGHTILEGHPGHDPQSLASPP